MPKYLPLLLSTFAMACSPVPDGETAEHAMAMRTQSGGAGDSSLLDAMNEEPEDCLLMVWSNQQSRDIEFDRTNDLVDGGAISCATNTSASQFQAAIDALRAAARSGDKARMLEQLGLPLLYIDGDGEQVELDDDRIDALYDEVFDARLIGAIERLDLSRMTVVPERGGFFELGSIWLVVDKMGARPRLVTVNRQALDEAAGAARRKAQDRQGEPVPDL